MNLRTLSTRTWLLFAALSITALVLSSSTAWAQITYTWAGGASAPWNVNTSWSPARTTPANTDILVFDGGGSVTATGLATESIGQLSVSGNTSVVLQPAAPTTLTIRGGAGADLSVAAGSALNTNTNVPLILSVATGATGSISGSMTFTGASANTIHQLLAADVSGITFQSGAVFTQGAFSTGNVFATALPAHTIVFASGSRFSQVAGSNPFGLAQPNSKVLFQPGSKFRLDGNTTPAFSGRTYADFEMNVPAFTASGTGTAPLSIDNITVTQGTLSIGVTGGFSIKGNVTVSPGTTLNLNPATPATVTLNGASAQTITGGTINVTNNVTLAVDNPDGIALGSNLTVGNASAGGGISFVNGRISTGASTLTLAAGATLSGANATSYVNGRLKKRVAITAGAGNQTWEIGDSVRYAPVALATTTGVMNFDVTLGAKNGDHPSVATSGLDPAKTVNRHYTASSTPPGAFTSVNLTFDFAAADLDAGADPDAFLIRRFTAPSTWSAVTVGARTATSTQALFVSSLTEFQIGELPSFTLAASAGAGGSITPSGAVIVANNGSQTFQIAADSCHSIEDVRVDGVSVGPVGSYAFSNVLADHTISASFLAHSFTIAATAASGGAISPDGATPVSCGDSQSFTITPADPCHAIADVLVDGISVGAVTSYTFSGVDGPHTIAASFAVVGPFTITASTDAGGAITPSGAVSVSCGDDHTFTIAPADSCHALADVKIDNVSVGAVTSYTFTDVHADHTIEASFSALADYVLTATAGSGGSIAPSGASPVGCSGDREFTISPDSCHVIADVLVDGVSVGAVATYTFVDVHADHTIEASFGLLGPYTITASAGVGGSIAPAGPVSVACGSDQAFTIAAVAGYSVADVVVDGSSVGPVSGFTFHDVHADHTIHATFTDSAGPQVVLTYPNGGEELLVGSSVDITWTATDNEGVTSIDLYVSRDGAAGTYELIAASEPNDGSYTWSVPAPGTNLDGTPVYTGYFRVVAHDAAAHSGQDESDAGVSLYHQVAGVEPGGAIADFELGRVGPNPSRKRVSVEYAVSREASVHLTVVDVQGRQVATLAEGTFRPGRYTAVWNGELERGGRATAGVYFVRYQNPGRSVIKRIVMAQ